MNIVFDSENMPAQKVLDQMKAAAAAAFELEGVDDSDLEVSLTFVSSEEMRGMNRDYRNNDSVTDVLSFPQFEPDEPFEGAGEIFIGDVVICTERAGEQAKEYGHSLERELVYLFTHSIFHLLGYDHMEEDEKSEMRACEEQVMERIGLAR